MARGWPAQLRGADGGGRAAPPTRESPTIYAPVVRSWKAPCRAWTSLPLPAEATATSCSSRRSLPCVSTLCESVLLACSAACREPIGAPGIPLAARLPCWGDLGRYDACYYGLPTLTLVDAGRGALVWSNICQPSARPQGVPVGPQSTCHAPDRGASTMSIPLPLGLRE
eukprot:scaffold22888_cov33-Phaeocystis_antarctica.AAC.2